MPTPLKTKNPSISIQEMIRLYVEEGKALYDVGLAAGLSAETVRDHLILNGVEIRKRGGQPGRTNAKYYRYT